MTTTNPQENLPKIGTKKLIFIVVVVAFTTVVFTLIAQSTLRVARMTPTPTKTPTLTRTPTNTPQPNLATQIQIVNPTREAQGLAPLATIPPVLSADDSMATLAVAATPIPPASSTPQPKYTWTPRPTGTLPPTAISGQDKIATDTALQFQLTLESRNQVTQTPVSSCQAVQTATKAYENLIATRARATDAVTGQFPTLEKPVATIPPTATSTPCP